MNYVYILRCADGTLYCGWMKLRLYWNMTYKLIRSNRKSIAIEVHPDGILVRAPFQATQTAIDAFVLSKADWIAKA